jgi:hypothetical protein
MKMAENGFVIEFFMCFYFLSTLIFKNGGAI